MKLVIKLSVTMAIAVVLTAGVALAANIRCDGGVCNGTSRGDTLRGSPQKDRMNGLGGLDRMNGNRNSDVMFGAGGADNMFGSFGEDVLNGGGGNDTLSGDEDRDRLNGGSGADNLSGDEAQDTLTGGPDSDTMTGGAGNDRINAADNRNDSIDCGTGRDTAVIDLIEDLQGAPLQQFISASSCETVSPRP